MTTRYYLIFIFHCVLFLTKTSAQSSLPDSLFNQGNYKLASLEYERLISGKSGAEKLNEWHCQRASCFKLLGDFTRAQVELSRISYWNLSDSMVNKYRLETAFCDYLAGSFTDALFQTEQINVTSGIELGDKAKIVLIKALCYNELMEWNKAKGEAITFIRLSYNSELSDSICSLLINSYQTKNLPRIKSEKVANVLRMLPGLGQTYAGQLGEGLFNFSLNLAFLSFGIYEIVNTYYITGYFVGAIGINKVYFGGHARTAFLLEKHNYKQRKQFCEKIKNMIIMEKAD